MENVQIAEDERFLKNAGQAAETSALLEFFCCLTPGPEQRAKLQEQVIRLGDDRFRVREQASAILAAAGPPALPFLRRAALTSLDLEVALRAERCLRTIESKASSKLPAAALRLIGQRRPPQALPVLMAYLPFAANETLADEVYDALLRLGIRGEKERALLRSALAGSLPEQRGAAALVLARWGSAGDRQAVHALLGDANLMVRLQAARGLLAGADRAAITVLVELLAQGGKPAYQAEALLLEVAGETAPLVFLEDNLSCRRRCREAWNAWWRQQRDRLDLAGIDPARPACPASRARAAASRFLRSLFAGDLEQLQQTAGVPFHLAGAITLQTRDEFRQIFQEIADDHRKHPRAVSFTLLKVINLADHLPVSQEGERAFLTRLPQDEVQVVHLRGRFHDNKVEEGALLVHLSCGRARVIGFSQTANVAGSIK